MISNVGRMVTRPTKIWSVAPNLDITRSNVIIDCTGAWQIDVTHWPDLKSQIPKCTWTPSGFLERRGTSVSAEITDIFRHYDIHCNDKTILLIMIKIITIMTVIIIMRIMLIAVILIIMIIMIKVIMITIISLKMMIMAMIAIIKMIMMVLMVMIVMILIAINSNNNHNYYCNHNHSQHH